MVAFAVNDPSVSKTGPDYGPVRPVVQSDRLVGVCIAVTRVEKGVAAKDNFAIPPPLLAFGAGEAMVVDKGFVYCAWDGSLFVDDASFRERDEAMGRKVGALLMRATPTCHSLFLDATSWT